MPANGGSLWNDLGAKGEAVARLALALIAADFPFGIDAPRMIGRACDWNRLI
jgi:hypothetical protein